MARSQYLEYEGSDHKPLISFLEPDNKKRRGPFRYDRRLRDNPEAKEIIKEAWNQAGNVPIREKIALTRRAITEWNNSQQRNSRIIIEEKRVELEAALTCPTNNTRLIQEITSKLNEAYLAEESFWKQRSRLLWLTLGDRNTSFFHATTKNRKRANSFSVIENSEGQCVYKEEEIAKVIVQYFDTMFTSTPDRGDSAATVQHALRPLITNEDNAKLIEIPSAD